MGRLNRIGPDEGPPINNFNDVDRDVIARAVRGERCAPRIVQAPVRGGHQRPGRIDPTPMPRDTGAMREQNQSGPTELTGRGVDSARSRFQQGEGYAVSVRFTDIPSMEGVYQADARPKPTILILEQRFPPEIAGKVGLAGGNMVTSMRAIGYSERPSRKSLETRAPTGQMSTTLPLKLVPSSP